MKKMWLSNRERSPRYKLSARLSEKIKHQLKLMDSSHR